MILMGTWPAWSEWKSDVFLLQQDQQNPKGIWRVPIETRPEWPQPKSDLTLFRQDQRRPDGNLTPVNMQHDRATRSFLKSDVFLLQQDQQKSIGVWSVLVAVKPADIPWECDMFISQNQSGPVHRSQWCSGIGIIPAEIRFLCISTEAVTTQRKFDGRFLQQDQPESSRNLTRVSCNKTIQSPVGTWSVLLAKPPAGIQWESDVC